MDRADPNDASGKTELFAATRRPCAIGGCAELCCDFSFETDVADDSMFNKSSKIHQQNFGDFAVITKVKPKTLSQGVREAFTDSDLYGVKFVNKTVTPQQKANVLAQVAAISTSAIGFVMDAFALANAI
eukprot:jgi/Psemu1/30689/gm1.30689_g